MESIKKEDNVDQMEKSLYMVFPSVKPGPVLFQPDPDRNTESGAKPDLRLDFLALQKPKNLFDKPNTTVKTLIGKRDHTLLSFFKKSDALNAKDANVVDTQAITPRTFRRRKTIDEMFSNLHKANPLQTQTKTVPKFKGKTQMRMDRWLVPKTKQRQDGVMKLSRLVHFQIMTFLRIEDLGNFGRICRAFRNSYNLLWFHMEFYIRLLDSSALSDREMKIFSRRSKQEAHRSLKSLFKGKNARRFLERTQLKIEFASPDRNNMTLRRIQIGPKKLQRRRNSTLLTDQDLVSLIENSSVSLIRLELDFCMLLGQLSFHKISKLGKLLSLRIRSNDNLMDRHVREIVINCGLLRQLDFSNCSKLGGDSIRHIIDHAHRLESLNLSGNSAMFEHFEGYGFLKQMKFLRCLHIERVPLEAEVVISLLEYCKSLSRLNLNRNLKMNTKFKTKLLEWASEQRLNCGDSESSKLTCTFRKVFISTVGTRIGPEGITLELKVK